MKKLISLALLVFSFNSVAETTDIINDGSECKSNILHYAASIGDEVYFNDLLSLNTFTLTDLNHQCDTVYHIAAQNGNINILEALFEYFDMKDHIYNGNGENLIQYSIKHQEPEVLVYLINEGFDINQTAKNEYTGLDYQEVYGNEVTSKIIQDYENAQLINLYSIEKDNYSARLQELSDLLLAKENELETIRANGGDMGAVELEIQQLREQIQYFATIIDSKNSEIDRLKELLRGSGIDYSVDSEVSFNNIDINRIISENKGNLIDIGSEVSEEGSNRLFQLLSRPIYKLEEEN